MGRKRKKGLPINGWIIIDKGLEIGSTQVVNKVRYLTNAQKAGHAGTLDPLASGILPIALGEATKTINFVQDAMKIYQFTVKFGEATDTDDAEGDVIETSDLIPTKDAILSVLNQFEGNIEQIPPKFSAIKINGERAYNLARAGEDVVMKSRQVYVEKLQLLNIEDNTADFEVLCGKGTYVRSIARDIARILGSCGHVVKLRRTQVGVFSEKNTISLEKLEELVQSPKLLEILLPVQASLDDIPALLLTNDEETRLRHGHSLCLIKKSDKIRFDNAGIDLSHDDITALAVNDDNQAIAIININGADIKPVRVFNI